MPSGTEVRVGNVTVGEIQGGVLKTKGLPLEIVRSSDEYKQILSKLEQMNLGGSKGVADRALVADTFFAKREARAMPTLVTADKGIYNKLAAESGIDLGKLGGQTIPQMKPEGFTVTINDRTIKVVPIAVDKGK